MFKAFFIQEGHKAAENTFSWGEWVLDIQSVAEIVVATHRRAVSCPCGRSHTVSKIALSSLVQFGEVHRRALLKTSSCSSLGIRVGGGKACGLLLHEVHLLRTFEPLASGAL